MCDFKSLDGHSICQLYNNDDPTCNNDQKARDWIRIRRRGDVGKPGRTSRRGDSGPRLRGGGARLGSGGGTSWDAPIRRNNWQGVTGF